jgi:hypothetical protein
VHLRVQESFAADGDVDAHDRGAQRFSAGCGADA